MRSSASTKVTGCSWWPTCPTRPDVVADLEEAPYDGADLLLGSVPGATSAPTDPLAPWESRVFRLK